MAGYPPPGDPYFSDQGNYGWIEEDPEEIVEKEEEPMKEEEEEDSDGSDTTPEVYNPPPTVQHTVIGQDFQGPTPAWAAYLHHWSRQQRQRPPCGIEKGFFDLFEGGSADRALPIIAHRIARQTYHARFQ